MRGHILMKLHPQGNHYFLCANIFRWHNWFIERVYGLKWVFRNPMDVENPGLRSKMQDWQVYKGMKTSLKNTSKIVKNRQNSKWRQNFQRCLWTGEIRVTLGGQMGGSVAGSLVNIAYQLDWSARFGMRKKDDDDDVGWYHWQCIGWTISSGRWSFPSSVTIQKLHDTDAKQCSIPCIQVHLRLATQQSCINQ